MGGHRTGQTSVRGADSGEVWSEADCQASRASLAAMLGAGASRETGQERMRLSSGRGRRLRPEAFSGGHCAYPHESGIPQDIRHGRQPGGVQKFARSGPPAGMELARC